MELKKLALAVVVGYVVLVGLSSLIHDFWLLPIYRQNENLWRAEIVVTDKRWVMWVGQFIFTVVFAWIYTRGVEAKPWVGQGLRFGILMTLLAVVPAACTQYVFYPIRYTLALRWMVAGAVQLVALALIVAWSFRKPAT